MATIRIATFNVENLFNRYALLDVAWEGRSYEKMVQAVGLVSIASRAGDLVAYPTTAVQRDNTARVILDSAPDVIAVQEVENLYTLRIFDQSYMKRNFDRMVLIDGNDPRGIDVGLMIRKGFAGKVVGIRSHVDDGKGGKPVLRGPGGPEKAIGYPATNAIFSRDCLEVDIDVGSTPLTLLVNHLKAQDGTQEANDRREYQAAEVANLVKRARKAGRKPVVLGDLNADIAHASQTSNKRKQAAGKTLKPLFEASVGLADPFTSLPKADQWTHYYEPDDGVSRLDYVLPDKTLTVKSVSVERRGLSLKCDDYTGPRYPTVGLVNTEASDHCAVTVELTV